MPVWDPSTASRCTAVTFRRGEDNTVGVPVVQVNVETGAESPADVTGWQITVELRSPTGDVWLSYPAMKDAGGLVYFGPSAAQLADEVWRGRPSGRCVVTAVHDNQTSILVDANFRIQA